MNHHQEMANELFDANIQTDRVIYVEGNLDSMGDDFDEFLDDIETEEFSALFGFTVTHDDLDEKEELLSRIARSGKCGLLVNAATPIPQEFHRSGGHSFSWGYCTTKWFYTDALDTVFLDTLMKWKDEMIAYYRSAHESEAGK